MNWKRSLTSVLALVLLGTLFISSGGEVFAASPSKGPSHHHPTPTSKTGPQGPSQGYQYAVACCHNVLYMTMAQAESRGPVQAEAYGQFDVSASYSVNVSVSVSVINAAVGFNVQQSLTVGGACYYTPPNGVLGWAEIDAVYNTVWFDVYWHNSVTGKNTYQGSGQAQHFAHFACYGWNN